MLVQVSPSLNIFGDLSYYFSGNPELIKPGLRVVIPLANRVTTGWITEIESQYKGPAKNIIGIIKDNYSPDDRFMAYLKEISQIYFASMGGLLDSSLYSKKRSINSLFFKEPGNTGQIDRLIKYSLKELQGLSRKEHFEFFFKEPDTIYLAQNTKRELDDSVLPVKNRFLISHDSENNYNETVEYYMSKNRSVLIVTPDNLSAKYLKQKMPQADIYNSEIKVKEMEKLWKNYVFEGKTGIIIGGITAVFLPVNNLGAVICDRAGSHTFKRGGFTRYDTHLLATLRAKHFSVPLVESFSTYTVSAYQNRSQIIVEDQRKEDIKVIVRRIMGKSKGVPKELIELLKSYFMRGNRVLIVLNKIKSLRFLFCETCKQIQKCPACRGLLKLVEKHDVSCYRCGYEKRSQNLCLACKNNLSIIEDISIDSLKRVIQREIVETGIFTVSAEDIKKQGFEDVLTEVKSNHFVISTPIILNPFFRGLFDSIVYIQPETHFSLDEYDAAEKIFSIVSELKGLKKEEGTIDVFSAFYFHYSLKLINEEEKFFERELKYREWFHLPPFFNVYHIKIKNKALRNLGAEMRTTYKTFKESLKISGIYLVSRKKVRGFFRGVLVIHATTDTIMKTNLLGKRNITVDLELI